MKKLICLVAALMLLFTGCGENDRNDNMANDGIVQDGDGIIDENTDKDNTTATDVIDDAAQGTEDLVDGATDAVDDAVGGMGNAVDDMTDNSKMKNR